MNSRPAAPTTSHASGEPIATPLPSRELLMKYAGGLVKHLGLEMYSGPVPAIAELVANAWDADAKNVWIEIPLDSPITDDSEIRVRDDGAGMSFNEVNERYLVVGLARREIDKTAYTHGGRKLMGRKGIGKLAGFGIARIIEVWTVKEGWLTAFRMDLDGITRGGRADLVEPYPPRFWLIGLWHRATSLIRERW